MLKNLIPCPFCESNVIVTKNDDTTGFSVVCPGCGLKTETYQREHQLIKYWNDRPDNGTDETIKEIQKDINSIKMDITLIKEIAMGRKKTEQLEAP